MAGKTLFYKRKSLGEAVLYVAIYAAALLLILFFFGIACYVFYIGSGQLDKDFFTTVTSELKGTKGIAGSIVNTLYLVVITLFIATPVGVGAAIYLNEYARPGRLVNTVIAATEILSGLPSVIFGLFGYVFFGRVLGLGYSLLNGALTLSLMLLPLIVSNTREALRSVPDSYRRGSLGLGAGKWHMIRTVVLPGATPGILTGMVLAVGRIAGESAALLFTAGSSRALPRLGRIPVENAERLFDKIFQSGGTLAVETYLQIQEGRYELAFGTGCVLILIILVLNGVLKAGLKKVWARSR